MVDGHKEKGRQIQDCITYNFLQMYTAELCLKLQQDTRPLHPQTGGRALPSDLEKSGLQPNGMHQALKKSNAIKHQLRNSAAIQASVTITKSSAYYLNEFF